MQTASPRKLINDRGGYAAVAAALDWPASTIHTWVRDDDMPRWRRPMVEALPTVPKKRRGTYRPRAKQVSA